MREMDIELLEKFVMDTVDMIYLKPKHYTAEGVKKLIAYRFQLYRTSCQSPKGKT